MLFSHFVYWPFHFRCNISLNFLIFSFLCVCVVFLSIHPWIIQITIIIRIKIDRKYEKFRNKNVQLFLRTLYLLFQLIATLKWLLKYRAIQTFIISFVSYSSKWYNWWHRNQMNNWKKKKKKKCWLWKVEKNYQNQK